MSGISKISWTGRTWNPLRARLREDTLIQIGDGEKTVPAGTWGYSCEKISPGCKNCYAEAMNKRTLPAWGTGLDYTVPNSEKVEFYLDEKELMKPLSWRGDGKTGKYVFPCSMTDMFLKHVPFELIDRMFAVMALCPQLMFQVLTKRAERMRSYMGNVEIARFYGSDSTPARIIDVMNRDHNVGAAALLWPLPNIWMGVSVENQQYADERIPLLLQTPAAVHWVSYEPALGPVELDNLPSHSGIGRYLDAFHEVEGADVPHKVDWIVIGGESGGGARAFDVAWALDVVEQSEGTGTACFVKQLGAKCIDTRKNLDGWPLGAHGVKTDDGVNAWAPVLFDRKGENIDEWPESLKVRQYPEVSA